MSLICKTLCPKDMRSDVNLYHIYKQSKPAQERRAVGGTTQCQDCQATGSPENTQNIHKTLLPKKPRKKCAHNHVNTTKLRIMLKYADTLSRRIFLKCATGLV